MTDKVAKWQEEATPHSVPVEVCFDRGLVAELEEVLRLHKQAAAGMMEAPPDLDGKVEELQRLVAEKTHTFRFSAIGRGPWRDLEAEHPPTDEQRAEFGDDLKWNPETFPEAALVATCTDPGLSPEEAHWLATKLPEFVWDRVWAACLATNIHGGDEKKALSTVVAPRSASE